MTTIRHKTMMLLLPTICLALSLGVARAEPAADALRGRVEDELLSDGISLARLGQRLELRATGTALEVVLVDRDTGKVVATRAVDKLPAEQTAAIAQLTVVVSDLLRERGLMPATRTGGNWAATFSSAAVVAYHRPTSVAVVAVAKPGVPGAETRAAAAALVAAYRAAGVAKVSDGSSLGEIAEAEDAAIVTRAAALAVDKVAIVRAFVEGPSVRAIVTVYGADNQLVTGFSAVAGQALAAPPAAAPGNDGSVADQIMRTRAAGTGEPPTDKDGVVRLWVQSSEPQIQLLRTSFARVQGGSGSGGTVGFSSIVCRAPCGVVVDGSLGEAFTFGIQESPRTNQFQLVGWKGDVTAHVKPASPGLRLGGFTLLGFGGVSLLSGTVFALSGAPNSDTFSTVTIVSGAAALLAGYWMFRAGAPEMSLTQGRPQ